MKSLKQILQNAAVYTGLLASLTFGAYKCGDGSEPNPSEDAQVQVDSGYDAGNLEDVLNTPDANGDDVFNGDKDVLDAGVDTGNDTGYDACVSCDADLTDVQYNDVEIVDTFDGGLDASDVDITDSYDAGDVDLTDVLDGGYDASDTGPTDSGDAGQGVPPVVIMETKDEQGNIKDTFKRGEMVVYDANKSYDPDCEEAGTCGSSKGMDYCDWSNDFGKGFISFPTGLKKQSYSTLNPNVTSTVKCYDLDDKLSSTVQVTINLID
jgi:hypothetical protein